MTPSKIGAKDVGPQTFKDALYESLHRSDLPLKAIADALGLSRSHLDKCCDETQPENLNGRHFPALAGATSDLTWLDFLESRAGRAAYKLPAAGTRLTLETVTTIREVGEFLSGVAEAVADGTVSAEDAARIQRDGLEVIAAINTLMAAARAQVPASAPSQPSEVVRLRRSGEPA